MKSVEGGVNTFLLWNNRASPASPKHCTNLQQKMFQPMFSALGLLHGSWHQAPSHWMNVAEASYPHGCVPSSPWWCSYSLQIRHLSPCCCVHYLCKCIHIRITMQDTCYTSIICTCSVPLLNKWLLWDMPKFFIINRPKFSIKDRQMALKSYFVISHTLLG